jgi:YVTN family beta-propeller protein
MTQPRRILSFTFSLAALLLLQDKAAAQLVYTTVPRTNSVVVIDSATNSVVATIAIATPIATGPGTSPGFIAVRPDAKFAYVVNQGCDASGSTVSVIDTGQDLVVATIPVSGCPREIAITPDSLHGYVTTSLPSGVGAVIILDLSNNSVVTTVNLTSGDKPTGIAVSPAGDFVRFGKSDGIYALDTATNTVTSTVIGNPQIPGANCGIGEISGTPDGNFLLVTCSPNEAVLLDAHTGRAIFSDLVSCTIGAPAITLDGTKAFVSDAECGGILDIAMATGVAKLFFLPGNSAPTSLRIAFTSDGKKAFASGFYNCCAQAGKGDVQVFDPSNDASIADIPVAASSAAGIAVMPNNNTFPPPNQAPVMPLDRLTNTSPVTVTFTTVSQPGYTSLFINSSGPALPTGFTLGSPAGYYDLATTAQFAGNIAICINSPAVTSTSQLFAFGSSGPVDITTSVNSPTICGTTVSLSPVAILQPSVTNTTTTVTSSVNPSAFGQQVSFTATVTPTQSSALTPTGNVTFSDTYNGTTVSLGTVSLSSGIVTFSTSSLMPSAAGHSITASYSGDNNFGSSTSVALTEVVNQAVTTTTLAASPNPSNLGQAVTLTATITVVAPGSPTPIGPTGTVTFLDGTTTLGTAALNGAATATFSTSSLSAASHSITATYGGDANFTGSTTSSSLTVTVQGPPPPAQVIDNETIHVTDTESFPDVFDPETIYVADAAFVTPLIQVSAAVAEFSSGGLGFSGQSGSQTISVSDIGLASLTLSSATIAGSSQFAVTQIACSNSATSFSTALPSGGVCTLTIGYTASATPANDNGMLIFTDNAGLSNLPSAASGSNFTQTISLTGPRTTTPPPPPPPAVVSLPVNETIHVTDSESFPDVFDGEPIHVTDTVTVTVLNTSVGTNVTVTPVDSTTGSTPVTVTFSSVTQPGITSLTTSSAGAAPPAGFQLGTPPVYYNLSTTATFTGSAVVRINYSGISFTATATPQLFHYSGGAWVNVTTSVDPINHIISGTVTSFSPFAIFQPTTQPPAITSGNITTFAAGTAGSFTVTATGLPAPTLTETGTLPSGLSFNATTGVLSGTPAAGTGGAYSITFTASNGVGTAATQSFALTVNQAAAIASANTTSFTFGAAGTFNVTATGFPAPTLSETGALPGGVSFNSSTGVLSGTPASGTVGHYNITFTASNGVGTAATQTFTLTVNPATQTIALTGVPSSATFGQGPFTISASATSGLPVSLAATGNCSLSASVLSLTGAGSCTVTGTQSGNSNYSPAPNVSSSFTIAQDPTITAVSVSPATVKYSDYASFTATVTPTSAGGQALTGNVQFYLNGNAVGSPVTINSSGVATLPQTQVNLPAGSYPVKAVFTSTNTNFAGSNGSTTQIVTQENAFVLYSGDTIAQVGSSLTLRATVWDSAAVGYPGTNPETGPTATIGDITKMWIAFDIYQAGSCGSGTPSTLYAQVALTSTAGVGTATTTLNSASEVSYCVVPRLVAGTAGGTNQFYTAPNAETVGVDFYVNSGQFATGGGWVNDPSGSHGNFGFNARYNSTGSPKGQMVYIYRALYNGVPADFIIKSNALSALQFSGTTYPISSTLQGKANVQVNRASDGYSLFSAGNYTFSATVTDSGQNGTAGKQFSLIVYDSSGAPCHSVPAGTSLQGGNVVVHSK